MNIQFIYRNNNAGFSILRALHPIQLQLEKNNKIEVITLPCAGAGIKDIYRNRKFLHQENHVEITHITGDVHYMLWFNLKGKSVVTVHDIMYYDYLSGLKKILWKWLYIDVLKKADHIVFISEFSKRQVLDLISVPPEKYSVIPNPINSNYSYIPKEFNPIKPRILHIGTLERKNLERSILALSGISCHLRIIGNIDENIKKLLLEKNVEFSNEEALLDEQIHEEYINCDIVNFPSLFEGFGMPIIEGQAIGRIVVTSNIEPMFSVANNAAVFVNPYSIESIRDAYIAIINNKALREGTVAKGLQNVKRFTSKFIAKQYHDIYKSLI